MTWTAPHPSRTAISSVAGERALLEEFLAYHRTTLLGKCAGLTGEQLARREVPPSELSLLGLLRHMTEVERAWFRRRLCGESLDYVYCAADEDGDFDGVEPWRAERDHTAYVEECAAADSAAADVGLDATFVHPGDGGTYSLRWVYLHMIEEYARHNGHADLLRERIDGATGE